MAGAFGEARPAGGGGAVGVVSPPVPADRRDRARSPACRGPSAGTPSRQRRMRSSIRRHVRVLRLLARVALDRAAVLPFVLVPLVLRRGRRVHRHEAGVDAGLHVAAMVEELVLGAAQQRQVFGWRLACARSPRRSARSRRVASTSSTACRCPAMPPPMPPPPSMTERWNVSGSAWKSRMSTSSRWSLASAPVHSARSRAASSMIDELSTATTVAPKRSMIRSDKLGAAAAEIEHARAFLERKKIEQPLDLHRRDRVHVVVIAMRDRAELLSIERGSGGRIHVVDRSRQGATRKSNAMPGSASAVHNR